MKRKNFTILITLFNIKELFFLLIFCFIIPITALPQPSSGFNYQAVARDSNGSLIVNTDLTIVAGLRMGSATGELLWEEQQVAHTNDFGLFQIVIGDTLATRSGGSLAYFNDIDWTQWPYFLQVNLNGSEMGTFQLLSVPFALNAKSVTTLKKLDITGDATANPDSALFIVRNEKGQAVFAVYSDGVRVYVDTSQSKRSKGGFAVSGFGNGKGAGPEYLRVTPDSVRIYLDTKMTKRSKGGFAVSGYGSGKAGVQEYLRVTQDSTRIYVNNNPAKRSKGGFAVGGFTNGKGSVVDFLNLTPDNYFIGHESGISNTIGKYNNFLGYRAGRSNTAGTYNTFIGFESGYSNTGYDLSITVPLHGANNTFVGYRTGYSNTMGDYNTIIGSGAGLSNTEGRQNTFLGYNSGEQNELGVFNTFLGANSGARNTTGRDNVFCGSQAGMGNITGENNTYVGNGAGKSIGSGSNNTIIGNGAARGFMAFGDDGTGNNNVYIGYEAGHDNKNGSNNVFIGYNAGYGETGTGKLYIANSSTDTPLIWGDFQAGEAKINGSMEVTGTIINPSDRRFKKDIQAYTAVLEKIKQIQPVTYYWNTDKFPEFNNDRNLQIGVVAQDLQQFFPELVREDTRGYLAVDYTKMPVVLMQAFKEQQEIIENQQAALRELEKKVDTFISEAAEIAQLKSEISGLLEQIKKSSNQNISEQ